MTDTTTTAPPDEPRPAIEPIEIQEEMERSFLEYAMSVITMRALPDARDGLKPVHRRILYSMHDSGFRPDRPHVKCARVVGDVIANYHPHSGDAVYDALVRLAQPFSLRHPLIDFHGNYGSPDFPPAAMRYCVVGGTRVRLADGSNPRIGELAVIEANSEVDVDLKVIGWRGERVAASKLFHSGEHATLRLRTREGYELTGTRNHPVLCLESIAGVPILQWRLLSEIGPGAHVALQRPLDPPGSGVLTDEDRATALLAGAFVSEGWASSTRAGFNNTDGEYFEAVVSAYDEIVGGARYRSSRLLRSGRKIHELDVQDLTALRGSCLAGLIGRRSADKCVPDAVWLGGAGMKRVFLQSLFEGDGSVSLLRRNAIRIGYSTRSEDLAREVQQLLFEFGVVSRRYHNGRTGEHQVYVCNKRDARLFASRVGFWGRKQLKLLALLDLVPFESRSLSSDHVPFVGSYLRDTAPRGGREWLAKHNVDRIERWERDGDEILARIDAEAAAVVLPLVGGGLYFARVADVVDAGVQPVYSVRVDSEDHAFVADGFVNHNTECRLHPLATHLLDGLDEDTVDFGDNFSGDRQEPVVMPSRFPNLLVAGGQGIAVGMASNIPPHNLGEVVDATVHLIDNPDATPDDLMQFVKGPDFPTGAQILGRAGIMDAYRTGRGSIRMRAKAEITEDKRGNVQIVVSELPYQVSVGAVAEKVKDVVDNRTLEGIRELRDLSAGEETRLVFDLKRDANANVALNNLYKHTPLQTSFGVNMVALVDGIPRTLNLRAALVAYVEHQVEVVTRRTQFRLKKAEDRAHILEGLIRALDMIDEIIATIRASEDRAAAREALMAERFAFTEVQANYILDMPLARLTRLARRELEQELEEKRAEIAELQSILASPEKLRGVIKTEMLEIKDKFATARRAEIVFDPGDMSIEDYIDDAPLVVVMTKAGYIKTVAATAFRTQGRGGRGVAGAKLKEEDLVTRIIHTSAHAFLLFFSNHGKVYRLKAHEVPMKERTARGTAIVNLLPLAPDERIQAVIDTRDYPDDRYLFFATRSGQVKKTAFSEYDKSRREGFIAINLNEGDQLVRVIQTGGDDDIFMVSRLGMTIRFNETDVRPMGRVAAGVRGMRMKEGDEVVSCDVARDDTAILIVTDAGFGKRTQLDKFNRQTRGGQGVRGIKLTARKGHVIAAFMVGLDDEIFLVSSGGVTMRIPVRGISSQGRDATGVRVMNLDEGQSVASAAPILSPEDEEAAVDASAVAPSGS